MGLAHFADPLALKAPIVIQVGNRGAEGVIPLAGGQMCAMSAAVMA